MQTMFRLPWSADTCADKPAVDRVVAQKPRQIPTPADFMAKLKRTRPSTSPPRSPDHSHIAKKLKGANYAIPSAQQHNIPVMDLPLTPTEPAAHTLYPFAPAQTSNSTESSAHGASSHPAVNQATAPMTVTPAQARQVTYKESAPTQMQTPGPSPSSAAASQMMTPSTKDNTTSRPGVTRHQLQQVIGLQLDQAILFKHSELRCIEQELAKCQIALEQIRRCQLIPYPDGRSVAEMTEKALAPPSGYSQPEYAAPWGVTDGPYTRHYARWLIPDPKFDATPIHAQVPPHQQQAFAGRFDPMQYGHSSTRSSRTSRACNSIYSPTAMNTPDAPRRDPMIMKRKLDGRWVRLFDHVCNRGDYRNVQGFMNHCRMSHKEDLVDHEGAAKAYGIPLSDQEIAELGLENEQQPPQRPQAFSAASRKSAASAAPAVFAAAAPSSAATPVSAVAASAVSAAAADKAKEERGKSLVHPLIHSASPNPVLPKQLVDVLYPPTPVSRPASKPATPATSKSSFIPSTKAPHLSSILQKRGLSLNMKDLVAEASQKIDMDSVIPLPIDDGTVSGAAQARKAPQNGSGMRLQAAPAPQPASMAQKPPQQRQPTSAPSGVMDVDSVAHRTGVVGALEIPESPDTTGDDSTELSPCNPGLVSDHDDAEEEDEEMQDELVEGQGLSREKHPVRVADGDDDIAMMDVDGGAKGARGSKMG